MVYWSCVGIWHIISISAYQFSSDRAVVDDNDIDIGDYDKSGTSHRLKKIEKEIKRLAKSIENNSTKWKTNKFAYMSHIDLDIYSIWRLLYNRLHILDKISGAWKKYYSNFPARVKIIL